MATKFERITAKIQSCILRSRGPGSRSKWKGVGKMSAGIALHEDYLGRLFP